MADLPRTSASLANQISNFGVDQLEKLYADTTNFKSMLKKPSSIWKIALNGGHRNWSCIGRASHCDTVMEKYIKHFNESSIADMSPFMECEVGLLPHIIEGIFNAEMMRNCWRLGLTEQDACKQKLTALYIVYSSKMFRNRIEAASSMVKLQSANENLQNEVERLRKQLAETKLGTSESIASRVKARKRRR